MTPPLSSGETLIVVLALAAGIMLTRFVPFLLFSGKERLPEPILYLGSVLPHAAMAMLLVYCVKDASIPSWPHGVPELLGIAFAAFLQWRWNNVLASIACGTVAYMLLVQMVFA